MLSSPSTPPVTAGIVYGIPGFANAEKSAADRGHVRVALPCGRARRERLVQPSELLVRQGDLRRGGVLLEIRAPLRAGNRNDVVAAREHPRERELRRRAALLLGQLAQAGGERPVALEVLALHTRMIAAEVVVR